MIIPIRCFTCGKVLADKWLYFKNKLQEEKSNGPDKAQTSKILEGMGLTRMCCKRHMLGHVDLIDDI
jgi:DNA-directed RNA polymerase subunit N (RpoN/RPB10)